MILEISGDGTLEALKFLHTSPFTVRTATIASPLSGDYGGGKKTPNKQQSETINQLKVLVAFGIC